MGTAPAAAPHSDGYEQLVTLGQGITDFDWDLDENVTARALFGLRHSTLVEETREALRNRVGAFPATSDTGMKKVRQIMALKRLGNSLELVARDAAWTHDCQKALEIRLIQMELGLSAVRDGVFADFMVGTAIESGGLRGIVSLTNCPGPMDAGKALTTLRSLLAREEPIGKVVRRERRWMWLESGWWRSFEGIRDIGAEIFQSPRSKLREREHLMARQRRDALLTLASMAYTADHAVPPGKDEDLAPRYLPTLPPDPGPPPASPGFFPGLE